MAVVHHGRTRVVHYCRTLMVHLRANIDKRQAVAQGHGHREFPDFSLLVRNSNNLCHGLPPIARHASPSVGLACQSSGCSAQLIRSGRGSVTHSRRWPRRTSLSDVRSTFAFALAASRNSLGIMTVIFAVLGS